MTGISEKGCESPKHILDLNYQEKRQFLDSFDIILSDCDGVIWMFSESIPKAGEAINLLKNAGKAYKFVSNNDMRSDHDYLIKIAKIGAKNIVKDDFILPYKVLARYMKLNYPDETCYCVGTQTFCNSMQATGVKVLNVTPGYDLSYKEIRKAVRPSELAKIIAIDIHFNMTLPEFALIHQYLSKSDCLVLVNAMDDRAPMSKDLTMVAPGLFIKAVADCASRDPVVFGKPSQLLAEYILGEFQIDTPKRILFIGDNLNADVKFAKRLGFQTLFMLSGAHTKEEMFLQSLEDRPKYYADSLADFLPFFADYSLANELNDE